MSNPFDDLKADDDEADADTAETSESNESSESSETEPVATDSSDSTAATSSTASTQSSEADPNSRSNSSPEQNRAPNSESDIESSGNSDTADPADTGPAFEYSDVRQRPLYAREKTWDNLEDELGITVTPELRRMGIRDEETREIHDAILKVAIEHIDEIPELVAEARRRSE